jgi:hypothetical protein
VIQLNREAYRMMRGIKELKIVPGATYLLEEPGTFEEVALLAVTWFKKYLASPYGRFQSPIRKSQDR